MKISDAPSNKDGLNCYIAPERVNRAVKNARKLYLSPMIFNRSGAVLIHIDGAALGILGAKCSEKELEMFKLLISGYDQTEVARQLGISQSNVSRKIAKLKKFLSESK